MSTSVLDESLQALTSYSDDDDGSASPSPSPPVPDHRSETTHSDRRSAATSDHRSGTISEASIAKGNEELEAAVESLAKLLDTPLTLDDVVGHPSGDTPSDSTAAVDEMLRMLGEDAGLLVPEAAEDDDAEEPAIVEERADPPPKKKSTTPSSHSKKSARPDKDKSKSLHIVSPVGAYIRQRTPSQPQGVTEGVSEGVTGDGQGVAVQGLQGVGEPFYPSSTYVQHRGEGVERMVDYHESARESRNTSPLKRRGSEDISTPPRALSLSSTEISSLVERLTKPSPVVQERKAALADAVRKQEVSEVRSPQISRASRRLASTLGPIWERTDRITSNSRQRLEALRGEREREEMAEIRENPKINRRAGQVERIGSAVDSMERWSEQRQKRLQQMRKDVERDELADCTFRPELSKKTQRIVTSTSRKSLIDRQADFLNLRSKHLSDLRRQTEEDDRPRSSPEINARSKRLERPGRVHERLYEDARVRRDERGGEREREKEREEYEGYDDGYGERERGPGERERDFYAAEDPQDDDDVYGEYMQHVPHQGSPAQKAGNKSQPGKGDAFMEDYYSGSFWDT